MPAFGILLILVGVFIMVNVFNGNLIDLVQGKIQLNFTSPPSTSTTTTPNTPNAVQATPNLSQTQPNLTGNLNG